MSRPRPNCRLLIVVTLLTSLFCGLVTGAVTDKYGNSASDNGTITWVDVPVGNASYVTDVTYSDDGLGLLFGLARSFVDTVQPNGFPFALITNVMNGNFDIGSDYMELVNYSMGFAVCFAIGLLFVILLPVCGCCFCCCRCCCGNCGGDMKAVYNKNEDCKRMGMAQALFLMVILMGSSAGCVWMTNGRFTVALEYADTNIAANLGDIETYFGNTIEEFIYLAVDMYSLVSSAIINDIGSMGTVIQNAIFSNLNITDVITAIRELDTSVQNTSDALAQVITDKDALVAAANTLTSALNTLASDIDTTKTTCSSSSVACQTACDIMDTSAMSSAGADFSSLPDLSSVQSSVDAVKAMNLSGIADTAESSLSGISTTVDANVASIQTTVNTTLNSFATTIQNMANDLTKQLNDSVDVTSLKSEMGAFFGMLKGYDSYRVYFGYGLMGLFTVIVVMTMVGLCCGCLGQSSEKLPTERSATSNCGGCLLLIPVFVMFVVGSMLMLLTTLTFTIGGNMEKLCQPLIDLTVFRDFIDTGAVSSLSLGTMLLGNSSYNLKIYDFLLGCRANKAPFLLLGLNNLLPIESYLNHTQYTGSLTSDMSGITSIDLSAFNVLTPDMQSSLTSLQSSGLDSIDFAAINSSLSQSVVSIDVSATITAMETIRDSCSGASYTSWDTHITDMETIRDVHIPAVTNAQNQMKASVAVLEPLVQTVGPKVNATLAAAQAADDQLTNNVTSVLSQAVDDFVARIVGYIDQYATRALYLVYNDMARCLPLWNLYESFTTIICRYTVDALNAFWFGTGWALLFFIPVIVVAIKLSKYYRKMKKLEGYPEESEPIEEDVDEFEMRYDFMQRRNKVAPDPDYMD